MGGRNKDSFVAASFSTEEAAKSISHTTKSTRQKEAKQAPEEVTVRDKAAARCSRPIERIIISKHAKQTRAKHAVRRTLVPGKRISKKKNSDRAACQTAAPRKTEVSGNRSCKRHCEEVYVDPDETRSRHKKKT